MLNWGTRFWPLGPEKLDWTIDLTDGTFGPLRLGSTADDIKAALGRPNYPQIFGVRRNLFYERFALYLSLDENQLITDFQMTIPEREDELDESDATNPKQPSAFETPFEISRFDPAVRLPGAGSRALRRLTLEDFESAFASWKFDHSECYREWSNRDMVIYVDLMEDERTICTLGWMRNDE
ncbi:MAG TPA: hypothetical protein VGB77_02665 [Abditibacteriaceae bacterium]|jgi:hypothetical protein